MINRDKWITTKLGDYISEYNHRNNTGSFSVYSVTNDLGFCQNYFDKEVASADKSNYKIVPYGCFAYNPSRINVGSVALQDKEENVIVSPLYVVFKVSPNLNTRFLLYYIKSDFAGTFIKAYSRGAVRNNLKFKTLCSFDIKVPPMSEQEAIVAELDEINETIAELQQQIADLDTLVQSTFHDMFGDPEKNPFAFETYKLSELCLLKAGKSIKANQLSDNPKDRYPCYGGNGIRGYIESFSHNGIYPIIGRQGALCGNINLAKGMFYATEHAVVVSPIKEINSYWLYFALQHMHLEQYAHGVAQPGLSVKDLNPLQLYYPPLTLQKEFASHVEVIETAKAELNAQIADMQTLLASRMDYYFD